MFLKFSSTAIGRESFIATASFAAVSVDPAGGIPWEASPSPPSQPTAFYHSGGPGVAAAAGLQRFGGSLADGIQLEEKGRTVKGMWKTQHLTRTGQLPQKHGAPAAASGWCRGAKSSSFSLRHCKFI